MQHRCSIPIPSQPKNIKNWPIRYLLTGILTIANSPPFPNYCLLTPAVSRDGILSTNDSPDCIDVLNQSVGFFSITKTLIYVKRFQTDGSCPKGPSIPSS